VGSRISQILTGWYTDQDFSDGSGNPIELAKDSDTRNLKALLKRFGGDLPHGAIIKELLELGLITKLPNGTYRANSRIYARTQLDPDIVRQMSHYTIMLQRSLTTWTETEPRRPNLSASQPSTTWRQNTSKTSQSYWKNAGKLFWRKWTTGCHVT
jgi:hypothetical protein